MTDKSFFEVLEKHEEYYMNSLGHYSLNELSEILGKPFDFLSSNDDFYEAIHNCMLADLFRNEEFLNLPVLKHLQNGTINVFLFEYAGIAKCECCNESHDAYMLLLIDLEFGNFEFGLRIIDDMTLRIVRDSKFTYIEDILPLLEEHTDLFENPELVCK